MRLRSVDCCLLPVLVLAAAGTAPDRAWAQPDGDTAPPASGVAPHGRVGAPVNGVIRPSADLDPGIDRPKPPGAERGHDPMPVLRPPGSPGCNLDVVPK